MSKVVSLLSLRKQMNLTQKQIALRIGIPRSTYGEVEAGNRSPSKKTMVLIDDFVTTVTSSPVEQYKSYMKFIDTTKQVVGRWENRASAYNKTGLNKFLLDEMALFINEVKVALKS